MDQLSDETASQSFSNLARLSQELRNLEFEINDAERMPAATAFLGDELTKMTGRAFGDFLDGWFYWAQRNLLRDMGMLLPAAGRQLFNRAWNWGREGAVESQASGERSVEGAGGELRLETVGDCARQIAHLRRATNQDVIRVRTKATDRPWLGVLCARAFEQTPCSFARRNPGRLKRTLHPAAWLADTSHRASSSDIRRQCPSEPDSPSTTVQPIEFLRKKSERFGANWRPVMLCHLVFGRQ